MTRTHPSLYRGAALAALLSLAVNVAPAAERETMEIRIAADGPTEVIRIDDLAVGESRQLHSESGRPVTVVREAEALLIDLDGVPFEIALPGRDGLGRGFAFSSDGTREVILMDVDDRDAATWVEGKPGNRRIVLLRDNDDDGPGTQVRILKRDGTDADADGDIDVNVEAIVEDVDGAHRSVVIKRRVRREAQD